MALLTIKKIDALKSKEKEYKAYDELGLYLLIKPTGSKLWKFKYYYDKKEKKMSLGRYPERSLSEARELRLKYRKQVTDGLDPAAIRKAEKLQKINQEKLHKNTFEKVANAYLEKRDEELAESYSSKIRGYFKNDVYPFIGQKPIDEVTSDDIIYIIKHVEKRGAIESAHRLYTQLNKLFRNAKSNKVCANNPCTDIDKQEVLSKPKKGQYATLLKAKAIKLLLQDIENYRGYYTTVMALKLAPHVALRPYNIRYAEWSEIDFEEKLWLIPGGKMKTGEDHVTPLTEYTLNIFLEMKRFSGTAKYIFHSRKSPNTPMSDATLNKALRSIGYDGDIQVVHGFRAMFSTTSNEKSEFRTKVIEAQLAHTVGSATSQTYNRAKYLKKRRKLMKWWSQYLLQL